jgi:hypothetical protein
VLLAFDTMAGCCALVVTACSSKFSATEDHKGLQLRWCRLHALRAYSSAMALMGGKAGEVGVRGQEIM